MLFNMFKNLTIVMSGVVCCLGLGVAQADVDIDVGEYTVTLSDDGQPLAVDGTAVIVGEEEPSAVYGNNARPPVGTLGTLPTSNCNGYCDVMEARDYYGSCYYLLVQHGYWGSYHWHLMSCSSWEYYYSNAANNNYHIIVNGLTLVGHNHY